MQALFLSFVFIGSMFAAEQPFVNSDLKELLKVMGVQHNGSLKSIVEATQKAWTRPAGKERWEVEDTLNPVQRKAVIDYCTKQGYFDVVKPAYKEYDYAIVLGATISRMEKRIAYLHKMTVLGIRFKKVILLSAARPLDPSAEIIPPDCKTEGDAMAYLWKANELSRKVPWEQFVCPLMSTEGKVRSLGAPDTLRLWLATKPAPGRCCMISNQPYCKFHHFEEQNVMPMGFFYETVGSGVDGDSQNAKVLLDTIALCLYQLNQRN